MKNSADLTGVILAGGEGRRMGGQDKGWITLRDKPLVEWVLERLQPQVETVIISANRNLDRYRALSVTVVQVNAPEYAVWYDAPQQHDFTFLDIPPDLRDKLAREFHVEQHAAPEGLVRGVTRRIDTIVRNGTVVYGRADMPDGFAYAVARALDEHKDVLQWSILPFSYDPNTVWKLGTVPLHPGAEKYYRERGYLKSR